MLPTCGSLKGGSAAPKERCRLSTVSCQLATGSCQVGGWPGGQLSTVNWQLATVSLEGWPGNCQLFIDLGVFLERMLPGCGGLKDGSAAPKERCRLSTVNCQLSTGNWLSTVNCSCQLATGSCQLGGWPGVSTVSCGWPGARSKGLEFWAMHRISSILIEFRRFS